METIIISTTPMRIGFPKSILAKNDHWSNSCLPIVPIQKPSKYTNAMKKETTITYSEATTATKTVYRDNWFDNLAINYISQTLQDTSGMRNEESGYESLVVASRAVFRSFDSIQQRQLVVNVLQNAIPRPIIIMIKKLLVPSKFTRQCCAAFTSIFFLWLLGPCEVRESEFKGSKEKNVVFIKKCRFLETSNCAGMCTNLCKVPSQDFMNTLGIPVNMVPNFEDMSCEMIFGQDPPAIQDDPAFKQPCYELCNVKHRHNTSCIS